jgi:hypothetical protein
MEAIAPRAGKDEMAATAAAEVTNSRRDISLLRFISISSKDRPVVSLEIIARMQ